jgi:hypothetical protein
VPLLMAFTPNIYHHRREWLMWIFGLVVNMVKDELSNAPWTWVSLTLLWVVVWASAVYLVPQILLNTEARILTASQLQQINLKLVRQTLLDAPAQYCSIQSKEGKRMVRHMIEEAQEEYFILTKREYRILDCKELSIMGEKE